MESVPCPNCTLFFPPRNSLQIFCTAPDCQLARKSLWQKKKLVTDPDYKGDQQLSKNKWAQNNPGYWKEYRERHPKKTQRNRDLQKIRNLKKKGIVESLEPSKTGSIAKMDSRKAWKHNPIVVSGEYWMVPKVAKMDPVKVYLSVLVPVSP